MSIPNNFVGRCPVCAKNTRMSLKGGQSVHRNGKAGREYTWGGRCPSGDEISLVTFTMSDEDDNAPTVEPIRASQIRRERRG